MHIKIISYSLTGNNDAVAKSLAAALGAQHIQVTEKGKRTMPAIFLDLLLNRTPSVNPTVDVYADDLVIFIAPVWLGRIATPLRAYFKQLKNKQCKYAYVSISGGADGENTKLAGELKSRVGREPVALVDLHIAALLPPVPKPTRNDTMQYHITEADVKKLTDKILSALQPVMAPILQTM